MNIKVINAGNCMICGREIKIVAKRENNKFPNIFFCPGVRNKEYRKVSHRKKVRIRNDKKKV